MPYTSDFSPPLTSQPAPFDNNTAHPDKTHTSDTSPPTSTQPNVPAATTTASDTADVTLVHQDTSTADQVVSTNVMTTLWSYTLPAGTMTATSQIRVRLYGSYLANVLGGVSFTWRFAFGGTTFFGDSVTSTFSNNNSSRGPVMIDFSISNMGATNSNRMDGLVLMGDNSAPTNGVGNMATIGPIVAPFASAAKAIDTASAQAITVSVQPNTSSANVLVAYRFVSVTLEAS